ncbi:MAG: sensor histidine kinase, partial [Hypericibacter sp.]
IKSGQFGNGEKVLRSIVPMVQETLDEVRRISMDLRPSILDDLGIVATIGWFCRNFSATCADLRIELDLHVDEREVPESLKIVIYRVLQEAMTNIGKHARADFVRVRLSRPVRDFELVIEDNGCGFEVAEVMARGPSLRGVGLASMRERVEVIGGRLSIQSGKQIGTVIQAILPSDGPAEGRASAGHYS